MQLQFNTTYSSFNVELKSNFDEILIHVNMLFALVFSSFPQPFTHPPHYVFISFALQAENIVSTPTTTTHSSTTTPSTSLQSSTTETVSPASGTNCQPNYTWTENICWRLDTFQTTWDEARAICQGEGGDLLMLKNESFLQHVQTYLQTG